MRTTICQCSVDDIFNSPLFLSLAEEYAAEASRNGALSSVPPNREQYRRLVDAGLMTVLGVFDGDLNLVGFCTVLVSPIPHYEGEQLASTETLFVSKVHRGGGCGRRLIAEAEQVAKDKGAAGLYISAPTGGNLARVLPEIGYAETNRVFLRML